MTRNSTGKWKGGSTSGSTRGVESVALSGAAAETKAGSNFRDSVANPHPFVQDSNVNVVADGAFVTYEVSELAEDASVVEAQVS